MEGAIDVVFFDLKDTLGEVYRPGKLTPYRPSTTQLLGAMRDPIGVRLGVISNLPATLSADQGRVMIEDAGLAEYFEPELVVFNHDANADKPSPQIFRFAASKARVAIERCLYVSENLVEVLGCQVAGMRSQLKPCPPGREFIAASTTGPKTTTDSGRVFERLVEEDHLIGKRIVGCAAALATRLASFDGSMENLPASSMGLLVYLLEHFIDRFHHSLEEKAIFPIALVRGADPAMIRRMLDEHELGRAYFRALGSAVRRIGSGDARDIASDFSRAALAFVELYRRHGPHENDVVLPAIGALFNETDDVIVSTLIRQEGPPNLGPYVALIEIMERDLGIS